MCCVISITIWYKNKSVKLALASSTTRGLRIAQNNRTDNAKPTPNINILSCHIVKVRVCAYAYTQYTQKMYHTNRHKEDNLYPVGHLSLLSPDYS